MIIAQTFKVDLFDFEMRRMSVKQNWMSWDNTSSVPEVKSMGVELIGVNKLGLINWSQLIGVN